MVMKFVSCCSGNFSLPCSHKSYRLKGTDAERYLECAGLDSAFSTHHAFPLQKPPSSRSTPDIMPDGVWLPVGPQDHPMFGIRVANKTKRFVQSVSIVGAEGPSIDVIHPRMFQQESDDCFAQPLSAMIGRDKNIHEIRKPCEIGDDPGKCTLPVFLMIGAGDQR